MSFSEIVQLMGFLSPAILLVGLCIGFYYFKSLNLIHKAITWYLLILLIVDITSRIFAYYGNNNLFVLLVYSLIEMIAFTYFYYKYVFKARHRLVLGLSIAASLYIIWEIIIFKFDVKQFQTYTKVVDDFIVITLVLSFFHEKINIFKESKWDNFRLNAVILFFFSVNLIFFLPYNFIINKTAGFQFYFWLGILITTVLFYLFLIYFVWKNGRTQK